MKQHIGNTSALKWVWHISGKAKVWPLLQTLVRIVQGCISLLYASFLGKVVDSAASGDKQLFTRQFILFAVLTASSIVFLLFNRYFAERSKNALDKAFRLRVFSQLLRRDYSQVSRTHTGEWMNRITSDTDVISKAVSQIVPETVGALVRVGGALIVLLQIVPQITWILIPGGVLMAGISYLFQKKLKRYHKDVQSADGSTRSFMQERLYSLLVIHAFTQEEASEAMADRQIDELNTARMRRHRFALFCNAALGFAMITAQLLGIGFCGLGILRGTISYGTLSTVLYLVNILETPLRTMSGYISQYYGMLASAERLMEIETYKADIAEDPITAETIGRYYAESLRSLGLDNVCFAYDDGEEHIVLKNFSLDIPKGAFIAFTGESGCGKSTTLKMLLDLYPLNSGCLYLCDTDDKRQPLTAAWRGLFAYVPQGNQLISGTIRETICFSDPALMTQDERIYRALKIACADGFIQELPHGLDTLLGERGAGLSEGQMQRLSIARAILSERPVLLLDEATSALDAPTEEQLLKNLRSMTDRTVLIITHREAVLDYCDKHIHFEKPPQQQP